MKPLVPLDPDFLRVLNEVVQDQTEAFLAKRKLKQLAKNPYPPRDNDN
jgi:hypothetical protein